MILSLIWQSEHLGAAYYNIETSELYVMDDMIDNSSFEIAKALYRQLKPHSLITIGGTSEAFLDAVKLITIGESLRSNEETSLNETSSCNFKLLTKSEHSFDYCFSRVQSLKLEGEPSHMTYDERNTYLSSFLNFNSRSMIHALGLLLKYLDREWHRISPGHLEQALFVNISYISL